jgi:hypothetical protein
MTTYRRFMPASPRGQWFGWGISLLAHAGVLAWLLHMPPPAPPAATPAARMRFVLVPPRPWPAVPVALVPVQRAAASSPALARARRSHAKTLAPAPASTNQMASEAAAPTAIVTADTPSPAQGATPEGTESVGESAGSAETSFDMGAARATARLMTKHRNDSLVAFPRPEAPLQRDDRLGRAIERARRGDCKSAYSGLGLLAVIPLAKDTLTGTGCKW